MHFVQYAKESPIAYIRDGRHRNHLQSLIFLITITEWENHWNLKVGDFKMGATYNFSKAATVNNHCCCEGEQSSIILWRGANSPLNFGGPFNSPAALGFVHGANNRPNTSTLKSYQALEPIHRATELLDLSFIKLSGDNVTGTLDITAVVFDFQGNILRTISTTPIDFKAAPLKTWLPISLVANAADLKIDVGEGVACQLQFSADPPSNSTQFYQIGGTGKWI